MGALRDHFLNLYPYTDFHELNADWLIKTLMKMIDEVENFVAQNAIKYADPIQWNITRQYEKNTIVVDPITGTAYISNHPVPMGIALSNTHYWSVVFDLGRFITLASQNFANTYEAVTTTTATQPTDEGNWVVWDSILYQAKNDIHVGDAYVIDGNIEKRTVEDFFNDLKTSLASETQTRADEDARIELGLRNLIASEIHTRESEDARIELELGDLIASEVTARENADDFINALIRDLGDSIGDLNDLHTEDKSSIVNAINDINTLVADRVLFADTVNDMLNVDAQSGDMITTKGFYQISDGGGANYYVTDTGSADSIFTFGLVNGNYATLIKGEEINVLQIGCKNDNTEDISPIINSVSVSGKALYFPIGNYRIENSIITKSNVRGDSTNVSEYLSTEKASQFHNYTGSYCIIHRGVQSSVKDIVVISEGAGGGILDDGSGTNQFDNVSVLGLQTGVGIRVQHGNSRACVMNDIVIHSSRTGTYDNYGLQILGNDNRFNNIAIMGCRVGAMLGGLCMFNNVHIWCGAIESSSNTWWNNTLGFDLRDSAYIIGDNIYIDTAACLFAGSSVNSRIFINNFVHANDGQTGNSSYQYMQMFANNINKDQISIVNGYIMGTFEYATNFFAGINKPLFSNIFVQFNANSYSGRGHYALTCDINHTQKYSVDLGEYNGLQEVARFKKSSDHAYNALNISRDGNIFNLYFDASNAASRYQSILGSVPGLYWANEGDYYVVYMGTGSGWYTATVTPFGLAPNSLIDYDHNLYGTHPIERKRTTSTTGMTQITSI